MSDLLLSFFWFPNASDTSSKGQATCQNAELFLVVSLSL
jgi:hypothetical protein